MIPHTLSPPPSPYTTLFRSDGTVPGGRRPDEHPHGSPRPRPPCPHALRAAPGTAALSRGNVVFRSPQRKLRAPSRGVAAPGGAGDPLPHRAVGEPDPGRDAGRSGAPSPLRPAPGLPLRPGRRGGGPPPPLHPVAPAGPHVQWYLPPAAGAGGGPEGRTAGGAALPGGCGPRGIAGLRGHPRLSPSPEPLAAGGPGPGTAGPGRLPPAVSAGCP